MKKHTTPDWTDRELKATQGQLADVVKHAYTVLYVEGMLRAEKEGITFLDAIECELAERGLLTIANGILQFEQFRRGPVIGIAPAREEVDDRKGLTP